MKFSNMNNYIGPENTSLIMAGRHEMIREHNNQSAVNPPKRTALSPVDNKNRKLASGNKNKFKLLKRDSKHNEYTDNQRYDSGKINSKLSNNLAKSFMK